MQAVRVRGAEGFCDQCDSEGDCCGQKGGRPARCLGFAGAAVDAGSQVFGLEHEVRVGHVSFLLG